jgi:hypothetical protein
MNRLKGTGAIVCGAICVISLLMGVTGRYFSRVLFDRDMFAERVADSFSNPHVAKVVATQATDQIIGFYRDLTPYRPLLLGTVENVISSPPFRAVARRAAKEIHPVLITHGEDLSMTVRDLTSIVRTQLASFPAIAEKLPPKAVLVIGSTEDNKVGRSLMTVLRMGHRMERRALWWLLIGLVAGAGGVALSQRKDRYLLRVGMGLCLSALGIGFLARFGGPIVAALIQSPVGSELIRGLWPVFIGPLALRMLILAGLGLVIVAGVTSVLERIDLAAMARTGWERATGRPKHAAGAIVRGILLIAAGIVVVSSPSLMLEVLAVVCGAVLTFLGIQEFFTTALRFAKEHRPAGAKVGAGRAMAPVMIVAGLVVLVGAGVFWFANRPDIEPKREGVAAAAITACNGYSELCDRPLNEVAFPTTHNSMSVVNLPGWMFPIQERSIPEQLEDGVRGFLIDIHYGEKVGDRVRTVLEDESKSMKKYEAVLGKEGIEAAMRIRDRLVGTPEGGREVYMAHAFCELGYTKFVDALEQVRDFLVANPAEVLIFVIQDEGVTPEDVAACFKKSGLDEFVYRGKVTPPWPTLREMVESDQRVVVFAENNSAGVPWYHQAFETIQETPYGFHKPEEMSNKPNRGGTEGSLLLMNHWIETAPASLPSNAEIVNAYDFLVKRARQCRQQRGMVPNLIAVDFYKTGDLFKVARTMNGIAEPAGPTIQ